MNRDQAGHADTFGEQLAHAMAGRLGRDHRHVDILRAAVMKPKWMLKPCANISVLPGRHVRRDLVVVEVGLDVVGHQDHDRVGGLGGVAGRQHLQAGGFRLLPALAARVQADDDVEAGIAQVQRVRVSLAAVADDGDRAALQPLRSPSFS